MTDTQTKHSPEYEAAEIAKMLAEVEQVQAQTRETEVNTRKAQAEAEKLEHEARKAQAEAREQAIRTLEKERSYAEALTADKYFHVYQYTDEITKNSIQKCLESVNMWRRMDRDLDRDQKSSIEIIFSSPGGSVIDGMRLFDVLQETRREGHYVTTSTTGMAASMAGILLQAGDHRVAGAESYLLIHEISFGAGGKIGEVEDEVAFVKKMQDRIKHIFVERSAQAFRNGTAKHAITMDEIQNGFTDKKLIKSLGLSDEAARGWNRADWWLTSAESLTLGLVDEIR